MNTKQLKWLSFASVFVMFLTIVSGSVDSKTESGLGCGKHWLLCYGKFIPAHTLASIIGYSRWAVSGTAVIISLGAFIAFLLYRNDRKDLRLFALLEFIFVMLQTLLNVVKPSSSALLALGFSLSPIAFACSVILVMGIREEEKKQTTSGTLSPRVSKAFLNLTWVGTAYTYIVIYIGAYVGYTDSAGDYNIWPLKGGNLIPHDLSKGEGIAFAHLVSIVLLLIVIAAVGHFAFRKHPHHPEIRRSGIAATLLAVLQVCTGAGIVLTTNHFQIFLFVSLANIMVLTALFGVLCWMSVRTWQLWQGFVINL